MKICTFAVLLFTGMLPCTAETFFIITDEVFDGARVPLNEQMREGIFSGLFEAGHIVLDDPGVKLQSDMSEEYTGKLIGEMSEYGMQFLVIVKASSKRTDPASPGERISSIATYYLYDVALKSLLGKGEINADNAAKGSTADRSELWYSMGEDIAAKIIALYVENKKKDTLPIS